MKKLYKPAAKLESKTNVAAYGNEVCGWGCQGSDNQQCGNGC